MMKKLNKEMVFIGIQMLLFYLFPLLNIQPILMLLLIVIITSMLSIMIGMVSKEKLKYIYPIITALLFIPSVFIYYNETAFIHSIAIL